MAGCPVTGDAFAAADGPKRRRRVRPLSDAAQARLRTLAGELPKEGDRITIRWPGGPHDFTMIFEREGDPCPYPGWHFLHGVIVEPTNWYPRVWSPMVHLVDGEWSLLPKGGKLSDL
jgi:hypothetical protein